MNKETEIKTVLIKLQSYCSKGEKCCFDILTYLDKYDFSSEDKQRIIKTLKNDKFVDESRYTAAYINDKFKFNKWGKIKIFHSLKAKNIDDSIIIENFSIIDSDEYLSTLINLLKQKLKQTRKTDSAQIQQILIRFAYSRGFEYEITVKAIKTILK